jgi:uridine kinase
VVKSSSTSEPDTIRVGPGPAVAYRATVADRPFIIGIAGGSSSGKTTVTERLAALTGPEHLSLLELDSYYLDLGDAPIEERRSVNYDHPDAFDWALLNDHLAALANGASVPVPVYDYAAHNRSDQVRMVEPARIIVVDGILVFWDRALRQRFDLKIFVDTAADIRLIRRLQRDVAERGRTPEFVVEQYLNTVRPAHERFIEPSKRYADVIIPEGGLNRPALEVLLARVRELTLGDG